ncbi:MAG: radical SAM family heme chaperone HemW [Clostridia bacterium]|nr:radical SAM family heme chaperone HemW [Clostridia bacterium]
MPGIYIHIPFCKHKCTYCDFCSFPDKTDYAEAYMACLYKEMELRKDQLKDYTFDTVYFGGGTPSLIDPKYIYGAVNQILKCFSLTKDPEITIEMNPGTVSESKIATYKRAGINRFSIGLQTAIDEQLANLGRIHNARDYVYATSLLKGENFSTDVMLGLKGQTKEDVYKTIELATQCGSSHISMYALTPEDGTPIYTDYLNGELPDPDEVAELYEYGRGLLKERGFERYEVSNFAKKGKESRHNLNYWRRGEYIGFGLSASSFIMGNRITNVFDLDEYIKCILSGFVPAVDSEGVTKKDARFEKIMLALRTREGLDIVEFEEEFGVKFTDIYRRALQKNREFLAVRGSRLRIKDEYLYVQNSVLMPFMEDNERGE